MIAYLRLIPGFIILVLIAWALRLEQLRARWQHQYHSEHVARLADRGAYEQAQKDADAKNREQVAKVEQQQQRITDDAETRYQADLARLRAELAKRLSQGGTAAPQGAADKPGASEVPGTPAVVDGKAVPLPSDELLHAAETELQLNALIDWVEQQVKVDPNETKQGLK